MHKSLPRYFIIQISWQSAAILLISVIAALLINHFRSDGLELPGDWSTESQMTLDSGKRIDITMEEAINLYQSGQAVFLDARPQSDYETGHIRGAHCLPWEVFDLYFESIMADIPEDMTFITYCDGEKCHLSKELAKTLIEMGYPDVRVLINGWSLWRQSQLPTDTGPVKNLE